MKANLTNGYFDRINGELNDLTSCINHLTFFSYERVLSKEISILVNYGQVKYEVTGVKALNNLAEK
jgi:hypothetical protein